MSKVNFVTTKKLEKKAPRILRLFEPSNTVLMFKLFQRNERERLKVSRRLTKQLKRLVKLYNLGLL